MTQRRTTIWADAGGRTAGHLLNTTGGASSVETAIAALSNAAVLSSWEGTLVVAGSPAPVAATYADVADVALLTYQTAAGANLGLRIPAPQASIFLADQETVDPAAIAALTALVIANVLTPAGVAISAYVGGIRIRRG